MAVPSVKYSNVNNYVAASTMVATFSSPTSANLLIIAAVVPVTPYLVTSLSGWTAFWSSEGTPGQFFYAWKSSAGTETTLTVSSGSTQGDVFSCEIQNWSGATPTFGTAIYSAPGTTINPTVTVPATGGLLLSTVLYEGGFPNLAFTETPPSPVTTSTVQAQAWTSSSNIQGLTVYATTSDPHAASSPYTDTIAITAGNGNNVTGLIFVPGVAAAAQVPYHNYQRPAILAQ